MGQGMGQAPERRIEIRMPFVPPEGIGLGDAVARITQAAGVSPCPPCKRRQEWLNQHARLTSW